MTARSPREDEVRSVRERLIADGLLRADIPPTLVAKEIEQSWRRSVSSHIDPDAGPQIVGEIDPDSTILRAAGRVMDQWQTNLAESRLTLFLADEAGRIVSRRIVDPQDERTMDRANAVEGFDFSEQSLGTNGLGTPIEARGVVFVRGAEHFNSALAQLACAGAPIKHPITGRIVGSLSLTSHVDGASPLMVSMARQAAQQIAEALESMADARDLELARTYRRFRSSKRPVLVMNSGTVMTDLPALARVDAESYAELWERLRLNPWDHNELRFEVPMLGSEVMVQRFGRPGQDAIFALEFLEPSEPGDGGPVRGAEPVVADLHEVSDGAAAHRPRPRPYDEVQRQLTAVAAADGLIRVVGGPGSGKRFQASRWLRARTGQEPRVVAARDLPADDGIWGDGVAALREGRGIIVVGGEKLSPESRERLDEFARLPRPGVDPGVRVVLTERVGAGGDQVDDAMPVRVPSLAGLRGELLDVVSEVAAKLFPGEPTPRFSPAALQGLLAWPWSGNVAELTRVVAALPDHARRGLVQAKDLPMPMQQAPRHSLSRYEQGERDAIVSALQEAGGNKARAADILGIGRTTLYRKMRSLKIDADERMIAPGR
ncbi:helix-turn-helix domain-containing protein [Mycobacterium sp. B14F4]|uniref:helix-turn-helix domain-containing protein n=1 Tax=Mycobacterium sp. B14F4 TaxID=3153565 RepID=UPI00325C5CEB